MTDKLQEDALKKVEKKRTFSSKKSYDFKKDPAFSKKGQVATGDEGELKYGADNNPVNVRTFKEEIELNFDDEIQKIADKHGVPVADIEKQFGMGIEVEREHSKDERIASQIALDHLDEFPDYYDRLDDMEDKAEGEKGDSDESEEEEDEKKPKFPAPLNKEVKEDFDYESRNPKDLHMSYTEYMRKYFPSKYKNVMGEGYAEKELHYKNKEGSPATLTTVKFTNGDEEHQVYVKGQRMSRHSTKDKAHKALRVRGYTPISESEAFAEAIMFEDVYDSINHPQYGKLEWRNEGGSHMIASPTKYSLGKIHAIGSERDIAKKWANIKSKIGKE